MRRGVGGVGQEVHEGGHAARSCWLRWLGIGNAMRRRGGYEAAVEGRGMTTTSSRWLLDVFGGGAVRMLMEGGQGRALGAEVLICPTRDPVR